MRIEFVHLSVSGNPGLRTCVYYAPSTGRPLAAVLHVHAFAEEQNKARRMVARQARALAERGAAVLLLDLHGCGDSPGEFEEARWNTWVTDVCAAADWLHQRTAAPTWLWGLRAGCLLASEVASIVEPCAGLLLWQPPSSGRALAQQFLRMKLAAGMLGGNGKGGSAELRAELQSNGHVEVAGYVLSADLLAGLEAATLQAPPADTDVLWFELDDRPDAALLPTSRQRIEQWRSSGIDVHAAVVAGPPFWQVVELEDAPALIEASTQAMLLRLEAV